MNNSYGLLRKRIRETLQEYSDTSGFYTNEKQNCCLEFTGKVLKEINCPKTEAEAAIQRVLGKHKTPYEWQESQKLGRQEAQLEDSSYFGCCNDFADAVLLEIGYPGDIFEVCALLNQVNGVTDDGDDSDICYPC